MMCEDDEINADNITFSAKRADKISIIEHKTLRQHTCDIIKYYLKKNDDDVIATARMLDTGKSTIYRMIQAGELN